MAQNKVTYLRSKVSPIAPGENFVQHARSLLESAAWRKRSINCRRLIDFLEIEHLSHGGSENGKLKATYDQLVSNGIGRRFIAKVLKEAEDKGLILVVRGGRKGRTETYANLFTLTYLPHKSINEAGQTVWNPATFQGWRWKPESKKKSANRIPEGEPTQCTKVNSPFDRVLGPSATEPGDSVVGAKASPVSEGEPLSISWGDGELEDDQDRCETLSNEPCSPNGQLDLIAFMEAGRPHNSTGNAK